MTTQIDEIKLPERLYFRINEVSKITSIKVHTLRYWEQRFSFFFSPSRSKTQHRMYSREDIKKTFLIKKLLHEKNYSINGAIKYIKAVKSNAPKEENNTKRRKARDILQEIVKHLETI